MTDKANNSHDLHDDSKKRNDQPHFKEWNWSYNQRLSTICSNSTNDAEQPTNISNTDHVVNDQTDDDFADPVREENNANRGSNSLYNWSKPDSGRLSMLT